jgi:hypothetical protein
MHRACNLSLQLIGSEVGPHLRGGEAWKRRLRAGGRPVRTAGPSPAVASAAAAAAAAAWACGKAETPHGLRRRR